MTRYEEVCAELRRSPRIWLITGVAGFVGSNLLETPSSNSGWCDWTISRRTIRENLDAAAVSGPVAEVVGIGLA